MVSGCVLGALFEAWQGPGQGVFLTGCLVCGPALLWTVYRGSLVGIDPTRRGVTAGRSPARLCGKCLTPACMEFSLYHSEQ